MKLISLLTILALVLGCAPHYRNSAYNPDDIGKPITVQKGEVENVRPAEIEQGDSGFGGMAGAYAGGVAGSAIGGGKGQVLATILGVVIGAVAGTAAEKSANQREAEEITVRLDDGRTYIVVQETGKEKFRPGDRVEILKTADGRMRVRQAPASAPPAPASGEKVREPGSRPPQARQAPPADDDEDEDEDLESPEVEEEEGE